MIKLKYVFMACMICAMCSTSIAQAAEQVSIKVPAGWIKAYEAENKTSTIREYIKKGETLKNWSEMITLVQTKSKNKQVFQQLVNIAPRVIGKRCQKKAVSDARTFDKNLKELALVVEIACDHVNTKNTPPGVVAYKKEMLRTFTAISPTGIYSLQLAWHDNKKSAEAKLRNGQNKSLFKTLIKSALKSY
ncbi:MAG: hypothetical protein OQK24_00820 [Magnetovibrio sp.]|nr:hypothetical protein [Magnetovibrio sp.]